MSHRPVLSMSRLGSPQWPGRATRLMSCRQRRFRGQLELHDAPEGWHASQWPHPTRLTCGSDVTELGSLMDSPQQPRPLLTSQWTSQAAASIPMGTGCLSFPSLLCLQTGNCSGG